MTLTVLLQSLMVLNSLENFFILYFRAQVKILQCMQWPTLESWSSWWDEGAVPTGGLVFWAPLESQLNRLVAFIRKLCGGKEGKMLQHWRNFSDGAPSICTGMAALVSYGRSQLGGWHHLTHLCPGVSVHILFVNRILMTTTLAKKSVYVIYLDAHYSERWGLMGKLSPKVMTLNIDTKLTAKLILKKTNNCPRQSWEGAEWDKRLEGSTLQLHSVRQGAEKLVRQTAILLPKVPCRTVSNYHSGQAFMCCLCARRMNGKFNSCSSYERSRKSGGWQRFFLLLILPTHLDANCVRSEITCTACLQKTLYMQCNEALIQHALQQHLVVA